MRFILAIFIFTVIFAITVCTERPVHALEPSDNSVLYQGKVSYIRDIDSHRDTAFAPVFSWYDENGKSVSIKDFRGKVVFLNFWGTWCPPCRHELPDIVALEKEYRKKVVFIGIALERNKDNVLQRLTSFALANGMEYELLIGSQEIANAYGGISGIPTTFIINKKGKIIDSAVGMRDKETFETMLRKAM